MVKNLIKNGADLLFRKQTNILSAASVIAAAFLLARLLGLIKYRLLFSVFSVKEVGLFLAAFKLPSLVFDVIVMGALTSAFIPVFTSYLARGREKEANHVASTVLNLATITYVFLSVVFIVLTEQLLGVIAPGLSRTEIGVVAPLTRIMIVGQTLPLLLGNFLTGILQSHKRFLLPALAPVAYNCGIILGIVFLSVPLGLYGPVGGVVLGAIFFILIQIPLVRRVRFEYEPVIDLAASGVREIGHLFLPRAIGLGINQISYLVTFGLSTLFTARGITIFALAQQLEQLPIGIFAATIAQAALPTLSEEREKEDQLSSFKKTFLTSLHQILFLTLPAAAILIVLRIPVVRLVYGAPNFDWQATVDTGRTLAFLGLGLVAEATVNLVIRAFFALHDSRTPVILGSVSVVGNVVLSMFLVAFLHLPIWALGLSMAVTDSLYAAALLVCLHFKVQRFSWQDLIIPAGKMFLAAGITGVCLYVPMKLLDQLVFDTTRTVPLIMLTGTATVIGLSVYLFLTWVLDISELQSFLALFGKVRKLLFAAEETVSEVVSEINPGVIESPHEEIP
ncbi:MAG: Virulence factor MviN [Microgenomates group bacterium GW2011_GWA1_48_10]|uniref:Lipid II flippase n=1 Tax=Candidatus Gottesmanbacteria bacterium RIFCSPHIGHO2_01_FULL_47_48 TaxID=1798381 RepID=A0A1F5ZZN7_9BACT|nr:MAG: Virulence factor MviN [Microgenomates group bacterium GW2011_GWA1_48_10]OGG17815.1 MAG: murein biosynthesis integral membrane protein MurJ [Candidatus Gottesmanbacteria bacterium RIFCSPHIGHO2_01_FULL_47_48]